MDRKKIIIFILIVFILFIAGCSKPINRTSSLYHDLYVSISGGITADSIILMDINSEEIINYYQTKSSIVFSNLKTGNYRLIVGKEEYKAYINDYYINEDIFLDVPMEIDLTNEDLTAVYLSVTDSNRKPLEGVTVTVKKGTKLIDEAKTDYSGQAAFMDIWKGVIYNYTFYKPGYSTYSINLISISAVGSYDLIMSGSDDVIYDPRVDPPYIFEEKQSKEISLGYLSSNETVIIGITPLNLDPDNDHLYPSEISVSPVYPMMQPSTRSNMLMIRSDSIEKSTENKDIENVPDFYFNEDQAKADSIMRQREHELIELYGGIRHKHKIDFKIMPGKIGDTRDFWVFDIFTSTYNLVPATLRAISAHAYIYVQNNTPHIDISTSTIDYFASEFDHQIFPTNMSYFATESNYTLDYDWDGNGKTIILLTSLDEDYSGGLVMGYFNPTDYNNVINSNNADIFYINSFAVQHHEPETLGTLAHEFQHLLFHVEKLKAKRELTDTWINEGFSGLAEHLNGYYDYVGDGRINRYQGVGYFNKTEEESLLHWGRQLSDYGASNLFALYLYNKCGPEIIKDIIASPSDPVQVISNYPTSEYSDFTGLFLDWITTNYVNDYNVPSQFRYRDKNDYYFKLYDRPEDELLTGNKLFEIKPNAVKYYRINGTGSSVNLSIDLPEKTGVIVVRYSN